MILLIYGLLAQLVEHAVEARSRNGSIPLQATFIKK